MTKYEAKLWHVGSWEAITNKIKRILDYLEDEQLEGADIVRDVLEAFRRPNIAHYVNESERRNGTGQHQNGPWPIREFR